MLAPMTRRMMTAMMMNLRPDFCGTSSSSGLFVSVCLSSFGLICTVPLICAVWVSGCSVCCGKLLSSEIIFVICLGGTDGAGQRKLGYVVLIERADVLVVGLLDLRLCLRNGQIVGHTGAKALLRVAEGLIGELHVRVGGVDEPCRGLYVEQAVAHILIDLLDLIGEFGFGLFVLGVGDLLLPAGLDDLEDGHADLSGGGEGAVRVAGSGADVAVVAGEAGHGQLVGDCGGLLVAG